MKKINLKLITFFAAVIMMSALGTAVSAQVRPYRVSNQTVQSVLDRIDNSVNALKSEIDNGSGSDRQNGNFRADTGGTLIANFENATDNLKNKFSSRTSTTTDVRAVLDQAYPLNTFIRNNRVTVSSKNRWQTLRTDLDTLAGYYGVRTSWNDSVTVPVNQGAYTVSDTQLRTLLTSLRTRERSFRLAYDGWARYGGRNRLNTTNELPQSINEFEAALTELNGNFSERNSRGRGIEPVLRPSVSINSYLAANRTNSSVTSKWTLVRNDLNTLASYYRLSWDWNNPVYPTGNQNGGQYGNQNGDQNGDRFDIDSRMTGTYRLNTSQSDNVTTIVDRAIVSANYPENQRDRSRRMLERRLQSPETLTLEKRGREIMMSSANAAMITLQADGVTQSETSGNGNIVKTTVTATDRDVTINYEGDRMNDYYVSFTPTRNGQLRVTRRVNLEGQNQTVTATSVYDKTSRTSQWNTTMPSNTGGSTVNGFLIPNNTNIVATLDNAISTRTAKGGDRVSMTVTSPDQYDGAVIEGTVNGQQSGVVSGRANLSISFETIRLRNGRTYRFAGIVDQVRQPNGSSVNVNNEGSIRDSSQTTKTVTRAGVGAMIGAIIGAIAGGGEGAAIGAGVGAGAGAGTVVLQGRDNLDLGTGAQFTITAAAPSNVSSR